MERKELDRQPDKQEGITRDTIIVTPGVPFRIPEGFRLEQSQEEGEIVEVGSVDLIIEGLGSGKLRILRETDDGEWYCAIRTPLGPIITRQIRTNDKVEYDPDCSLLSVEIIINGVTKAQAETLALNIQTKNSSFIALKNESTLEKNDEEQFIAYFDRWADALTNEKCLVWFPQGPEAKALKEGLEFTISL